MANPNCFHRGDHTCWSGILGKTKHIRECVRSTRQDNLSCLAARTRFCRINGTQLCPDGTRICDNDTCGGQTKTEIYANDEGQGLDKVLDTVSKRDTTTVNFKLGDGVQSATDLPIVESSEESTKKSGTAKLLIPFGILGVAVVGMFLFTHREMLRRKRSRRRYR
jgi:hypothetical protein